MTDHMEESIVWQYKTFSSLSPYELYDIMQLRMAVFVVEQDCVYQDADNKDPHCEHLMGRHEDRLLAYSRIVPPGLSYPEISLGRIITAGQARRKGLGKALMLRSLETAFLLHGSGPIRISAQVYLQKFYESFDFQVCGPAYVEDDILHVEMLRPAKPLFIP